MRDDTQYVICTVCDRPSTDVQSLGNHPRAEIPTVSSQDIKPRHTARRIRLKNSVLLLRTLYCYRNTQLIAFGYLMHILRLGFNLIMSTYRAVV